MRDTITVVTYIQKLFHVEDVQLFIVLTIVIAVVLGIVMCAISMIIIVVYLKNKDKRKGQINIPPEPNKYLEVVVHDPKQNNSEYIGRPRSNEYARYGYDDQCDERQQSISNYDNRKRQTSSSAYNEEDYQTASEFASEYYDVLTGMEKEITV